MEFRYGDVEIRQSNNLYSHNFNLNNIAKTFELDWSRHARLTKWKFDPHTRLIVKPSIDQSHLCSRFFVR